MVLSGSKRTSSMSSLVNGNQGGGNKKAGVYPKVGNDSWTSVYYGTTPGKCLTLACMRTTRPGSTSCASSRPVGSLIVNPRFLC